MDHPVKMLVLKRKEDLRQYILEKHKLIELVDLARKQVVPRTLDIYWIKNPNVYRDKRR